MFKNSKGELVPHCVDCVYGLISKPCPPEAISDEIDDEKGVLDCPGFMLRKKAEFTPQ
jgi:hypothetical protein